MLERQTFQNKDLVLKVSPNYDPKRFDPNKYEAFLDALCGDREYQKEAIRETVRYFLGGEYKSLKELAEENYHSNDSLQTLYGTFDQFKKHLQIHNKLSCSLDLATGTGKSYVIYGIARIMLAEGVVDHVLVVCPSTTIEDGLMEKFKLLSGDDALRNLLPDNAVIKNPHIINATESITRGTICVENCHALYEHVKSSIREGLAGKGERTLVINDETHHVYNQTGKTFKKWKEFLIDYEFDFKYIAGLSGTCYINDEYFTDVISRYSLREAIERAIQSIDGDTCPDSLDSGLGHIPVRRISELWCKVGEISFGYRTTKIRGNPHALTGATKHENGFIVRKQVNCYATISSSKTKNLLSSKHCLPL